MFKVPCSLNSIQVHTSHTTADNSSIPFQWRGHLQLGLGQGTIYLLRITGRTLPGIGEPPDLCRVLYTNTSKVVPHVTRVTAHTAFPECCALVFARKCTNWAIVVILYCTATVFLLWLACTTSQPLAELGTKPTSVEVAGSWALEPAGVCVSVWGLSSFSFSLAVNNGVQFGKTTGPLQSVLGRGPGPEKGESQCFM